MISLEEALACIERVAVPLPPRRVPLLEACGRRLAAPVISDVDSPPWDRAMMDGFAICSAAGEAASGGRFWLDVVVDLAAGDVSGLTLTSGTCARIMTGAPMPPGADAVVPIELAVEGTAAAHAGQKVCLEGATFRAGQHVARQGAAFRRGDYVLPVGTHLGAAAIGLAAEAGATHLLAPARPRVAILSTGSELVSPESVPRFGQTRNSNGPMLAAAVTLEGAEAISLGIAADRPEAIRAAVAQGLAADVLLLSGGVSAGDLDLVPEVLGRCGVEQVFHKVRLKPGKPVWFGILRRSGAASATLVFGLPGNPASSLVCYELFVRPTLAILAGKPAGQWHLPRSRALLTAPAKGAGDRPVFAPCRLETRGGTLTAEPLPWTGSSDLVGLAVANGLLVLPAGCGRLEAGSPVEVLVREG